MATPDLSKEALTELGMRLHFYAAEATNGFYFARATWHVLRAAEDIPHDGDANGIGIGVESFPILAYRQVHANVLFRSAFSLKRYHREAAYCLVLYKDIPHEGYLYLGHTLDEVLAQLPAHGYAGTERWLPDERATFHHHIAPTHHEAMWNSNEFGVALQRLEPRREMPVQDELEEHPF